MAGQEREKTQINKKLAEQERENNGENEKVNIYMHIARKGIKD